MIELVRRAGVTMVALSFLALALHPVNADADDPSDGTANAARALALMGSSCGTAPAAVAQVTSSPEPVASPEPQSSGSPTPAPYVGSPSAPNGPQILVPRPASPSPGTVTPPPLPSPTPTPGGSPGPVIIAPQTEPPSSTPIPAPTVSSGPVAPSASASPSPLPQGQVLDPNSYAILGDHVSGFNQPGKPGDVEGHVNIFYQDGVLGGDRAHYDGQRYIDITGHTFVRNRAGDTTLYADSVRFDTQLQTATLIHGRGESTQDVEQGKLHFTGTQMTTDRSGVTHVQRAYITTCENPRGGYHLESKTLDVYPGDKAVARSVTLFLGALAIFWLPIAVISLRHDETGSRKQPGFIPIVGYSSAEGFYVKARIGFSPSDYYYGYYRIEEYTRIGLGLGYVATLRRKDGRRQTDIDFFRMKNSTDGTENTNLNLTDQEIFSRSTRAKFALSYTGDYGPLVTLPPQYTLSFAVDHGNERGDRQNYSFNRSSTGGESSTNDYGFSDHRSFSPKLTNDFTLSYTTSDSFGFSPSRTLHFETLTHFTGASYDYDLTFDRYDSSVPTNVQKEPELAIHPHNPLFPHLTAIPVTAQYTIGIYDDPSAQPDINKNGITTSRGEARIQIGPALAHVLGSDLSAQVTVQQDVYGTGDLKAQIGQQATLTTPLFGHVLNTISYNESNTNGPLAEPFKSIDVLGTNTKQANDVLRIFNDDIYSLSLTATTFFNRQAQSVGYQLTTRPSPRSSLILGGAFTPGPGFGFDRTSVELATPFGYQSDIQVATFVDWKNHMRLESKNIYYRHVIGNCYEVRLAYNEDLKQVTATIDLLAFPSHAVNFGLASQSLSSIIPQSFSNTSFGAGGL